MELENDAAIPEAARNDIRAYTLNSLHSFTLGMPENGFEQTELMHDLEMLQL